MYELRYTSRFKKDLKKIKRNNNDFKLAKNFLILLQHKGVEGVPFQMRPHKLLGIYNDNWECHIKPDLLIIWIQFESPRTIKLVRLGSHSELFS